MAPPESGMTDSNVLKLEDIRNKRKKSTHTTKSPAHSRKADETHISSGDFATDAQAVGKVERINESVKPDLVESDTQSEVIKTPAKRSIVSNRRFDKSKVDRIKAELAEDSYQFDYLRVADKFIEHERFS